MQKFIRFSFPLLMFYKWKIRAIYGVDSPKTGSITFIQRFGSALNNNTHFHSIFIEGAFESIDEDTFVFHRAPYPTSEEVANVLREIAEKVIHFLKKRGFLKEKDQENFEDLDIQSKIALASSHNCDATGDNAGQPTRKIGEGFGHYLEPAIVKRKLCATLHNFSLHAATFVRKQDRIQLEKLIRYASRPPVCEERIELAIDGDIRYRLKTPFSNGTTHVVFSKEEFIARLAGLVPLPWLNLTRYNGVFAPASPLRSAVVSLVAKAKEASRGDVKKSVRLEWAELLRRTFQIDVTTCNSCGGKLRLISTIKTPDLINRILKHVGLNSRAPPTTEPTFAHALPNAS